jgi:prepilin-type N-terminal cleavage/methylation domain-containing protein
MRDVTRASDQSGFSLVEVLVAAVILVLGATAAFSLIDSANRSISANSARSGGTNLARELTEYARATDYDLLQPGQIIPAIRARDTVSGTLSGSTWTIARRNVVYTIATSVCTFDDPKDGRATTPPANACPAATAINTVTDQNPDDFRRVTFTATWKVRGRPGTTTQTAAVVNPAGGLGPRIERFDEPATQIEGDDFTWGGTSTFRLTSTSASSVSWTTDDGKSAGDASGGATDWGFTWEFGEAFSTTDPWVFDGTYQIQAQAKDSRGVPGEAKIRTVYLNRHEPGPVPNVTGGYNPTFGVVDLHWGLYYERDLVGYVVRRDGVKVCPASGVAQKELRCIDGGVTDGTHVYQVFAVDCLDLKARTGCDREGAPSDPVTVTVDTTPGPAAPSAPTGLTATVIDGLPHLTWTAPSSVPAGSILFYRIYRDTGTGISDRYDETITASAFYTDPNPGSTTAHRYWVTAVDENFNESAPSDPVLSPPIS